MEKGFTLIELVLIIVIIAVLSVVAVPMYKSYVRKSLAVEGKALVVAVASAEISYYSDHHVFAPEPPGSNGNPSDPTNLLGVDSRANQYFKNYQVDTGGQSYLIYAVVDQTTEANGLNVQGAGDPTHAVVISVFDNDVKIE